MGSMQKMQVPGRPVGTLSGRPVIRDESGAYVWAGTYAPRGLTIDALNAAATMLGVLPYRVCVMLGVKQQYYQSHWWNGFARPSQVYLVRLIILLSLHQKGFVDIAHPDARRKWMEYWEQREAGNTDVLPPMRDEFRARLIAKREGNVA